MYTEQYEYILNLLEYQLRPGHAISDLEQFMKNFLEMADETDGFKGIEAVRYIDGKIVAATPWGRGRLLMMLPVLSGIRGRCRQMVSTIQMCTRMCVWKRK